MSGNAKFSLIALAFFLSGCGGGILAKGVPITIEYDLSAKVLPVISSKQKVTLFLSVEDGRADTHPNQPDNLQAIESSNIIGLHSKTLTRPRYLYQI